LDYQRWRYSLARKTAAGTFNSPVPSIIAAKYPRPDPAAGVGFILIGAMEAHKVTDIMALTMLLFAFAAGANAILLSIEHRVHRR